LRALIAKGIFTPIEIYAILDASAESAERAPDQLGGKYSESVATTIRQMMNLFPIDDQPTIHH
jgi:predicted dehydrogenase